MVRHPVQRRVREDDVEPGLVERADVSLAEGEAAAGVRGRLLEHRGGGVDADRLARAEPLVREPRQLARAAAEVDDPRRVAALDEREEVEEGGAALGAEFSVPVGVPDVSGRGQRR